MFWILLVSAGAGAQSHLTLSGRLEYQACDDKICYMPQSIPVSWTLLVIPLDRK